MIGIDGKTKTKVVAVVTQTKRIEFELDETGMSVERMKEILEDKFGCAEELLNQSIEIVSIDSRSY